MDKIRKLFQIDKPRMAPTKDSESKPIVILYPPEKLR